MTEFERIGRILNETRWSKAWDEESECEVAQAKAIEQYVIKAKIEQLANMPYPKDEPPEMFIEFYKKDLERQAKELAELKKELQGDK